MVKGSRAEVPGTNQDTTQETDQGTLSRGVTPGTPDNQETLRKDTINPMIESSTSPTEITIGTKEEAKDETKIEIINLKLLKTGGKFIMEF